MPGAEFFLKHIFYVYHYVPGCPSAVLTLLSQHEFDLHHEKEKLDIQICNADSCHRFKQ